MTEIPPKPYAPHFGELVDFGHCKANFRPAGTGVLRDRTPGWYYQRYTIAYSPFYGPYNTPEAAYAQAKTWADRVARINAVPASQTRTSWPTAKAAAAEFIRREVARVIADPAGAGNKSLWTAAQVLELADTIAKGDN